MEEKKNKGGRPKKQLDYEMIEKLSMIQCTQDEIASCLNVNVKTLRADDKFLDLYKKGQEKGKASLRASQFRMSKTNATMAIWLGKQYLGQKDLPDNNNGANENPNEKLNELIGALDKHVKTHEGKERTNDGDK